MTEPATLTFLEGGGRMGALVRAHDWSATPLGAATHWPQSLRTLVAMVLASPQPMVVAWGDGLTVIYNDANIAICGDTHPEALGMRLETMWADDWGWLSPRVEATLTGAGQLFDDTPVGIGSSTSWYNFSWTPARDDQGRIAGMVCIGSETTAKVLATEKVVEEREALTQLFDQSPTMMLTMRGPEHRLELANPGWKRLVGDRPIIFGAPLAEILPDAASQGFIALLDRVYASGEVLHGAGARYLVKPNDAAEPVEFFIDFVYQPIKDSDGRVTGIFAQGIDVTSRTIAEKSLRESEMNLRQANVDLEWQVLERSAVGGRFWQISPDVLLVANELGIVEDVNPAWSSILGWPTDELIGKTVFTHLHPDDLSRASDAFKYLIEGNPILRFEARYRRRDGGWSWFAWAAAPLGGVYYASGRDITFEKQQTAALTSVVAERDRVWENSRDLLIVVNGDGSFRDANPAWKTVLGYDHHEVIGKNCLDFVVPEDIERNKAALVEASASRHLNGFETTFQTKDGLRKLISFQTSLVGDAIYAYGRDITIERDAQNQLAAAEGALRQAQKMDAIGQLTGGIAHDFNNMLAGISGSLEMIQRRLAKNRLDGIDRFIETAQQSSRRAAALTQRLLAFARRQTLDPKATDIRRLVGGMEELIRRTVGPGVQVGVEAVDSTWYCKIDPSQLENAVLNLCINARDAMLPLGGQLKIEVVNEWFDEGEAAAREVSQGQFVSIYVSDTGAGMSAAVIARAFEPFFTTKPLGEGTGLGLSMVYGFVRQSGGQVKVDSIVGVGTTMRIYLPRHIGTSETVPLDLPPRNIDLGAGETILLIDDEVAVRQLVAEVLREAGYRVLGAADGPGGLAILQSKEHIDLLVTDVGLPGGLNGRQVADEARALRPGLNVLFITGYAENAAVGNGELEPGMQVMTKPFELQTLVTRVQDMLAQLTALRGLSKYAA